MILLAPPRLGIYAPVPTYRFFCVDIPPAVMIEPVVLLLASVVRVELMPASAVTRPTSLLVVPTHRAFCVDIPPAVMIEPVVLDVASVTSVELMPCANRMREVVVVCPSFVIAVDKPVAKSAVSALNAVDDMTVPVTTGWPLLLTTKVPLPL
jgi:hypothetical protein